MNRRPSTKYRSNYNFLCDPLNDFQQSTSLLFSPHLSTFFKPIICQNECKGHSRNIVVDDLQITLMSKS
jgi:hypothetical protein